jgi:hypothetical protein
MKKLIGRCRSLYRHYKRIFRIFDGFDTPSFSGGPSKSRLEQVLDYLYIFFVLKIMPNNYHLFQFDTRDRSEFPNYLGDTQEPLYYDKLKSSLWAASILMHDKVLFKCLCECHGLPVPKNYALIRNNRINDNGTDLHEFMMNNGLERVIVKPVFGGGGRGIHLVSTEDPDILSKLEAMDSRFGNFMKEGYLVEEALVQHPELDRINPHTVSSIRIISMLCVDGSVEFLAAMLKTNANDDPMDNFSQGGIVIGVDLATGRLKRHGICQYPRGRVYERHPLTGTVFQDFQIPFWKELTETAERAQKVFRHVKSVGWDIAVTPGGPVIIEGNQDWGSNGIQAANGGLLTDRNRDLFAQYGITFYDRSPARFPKPSGLK